MTLEARLAGVLLSIKQDHRGNGKGAAGTTAAAPDQLRLRGPGYYYRTGKSHVRQLRLCSSEIGQIVRLRSVQAREG